MQQERTLAAVAAVVAVLGLTAAAVGATRPDLAEVAVDTVDDVAAAAGDALVGDDVAAAVPTPAPVLPATPRDAAAPDAAVEDAATPAAAADGAAQVQPWSVGVHAGLGAWVDVYDWSLWGTGGAPVVTVETIDALASQGVRTIYLQTTRANVEDAVLERDRLLGLVERAHGHGMFVVGWFLPEFVDPAEDWRRVEAAMALPLDGFALDIESQAEPDVALRTQRLLDLSARLREHAGDRTLVANVLPPVQMEELAPSLWPGFPWQQLDAYYDVWMPMGYFTFREDGHRWRDAEAYTAENVRRIRERVGDPSAPVHFIGGIADLTTIEDVQGMTRGARSSGAIGLSLYDVATTGTELWKPMQAWRDLG